MRGRFKNTVIGTVGAGAISLLGRTLSIEYIELDHLERVRNRGQNLVFAFWHEGLLLATYGFRRQGIRVLVSQHQDGEYISRVIEKMGYTTVRGSSTRGGTRALFRMASAGREGDDLGITVDGPRGPCLQVKPGVVVIASRSGLPIVPFAVASARPWVLSGWDRFMIPRPFSRAVIAFGEPLKVPANTPASDLVQYQQRLQQRLLDARAAAERSVKDS